MTQPDIEGGTFSLNIRQGASEIGGNCIELSDASNRILLDFGMPFWFEKSLKKEKDRSIANLIAKNLLPDVPGLYGSTPAEKKIDAILLSHSHKDHYGHLFYASPEIPILVSRQTKELLYIYWQLVREKEKLERNRFCTLEHGCSFQLPETQIKITLVEVDHSSAAASAALIDFNGTRIVYSGDIRFHGNRSEHSRKFVEIARAFRPHYLILEGTHILESSEPYTGCRSEDDVGERCLKIMKESEGDVFMYCSTTHLDRIATFCRSAEQLRRPIVMSFPIGFFSYSALKHKIISDMASPLNGRAKIFFRDHEVEKVNKGFRLHKNFYNRHAIRPSDYQDSPVAFVGTTDAIFQWGRLSPESTVIYSLYSGYLKEGEFAHGFDSYVKRTGSRFEIVHTSGHATHDDLVRTAVEIGPRKLIPVHTEHPELFRCKEIVDAGIEVIAV